MRVFPPFLTSLKSHSKRDQLAFKMFFYEMICFMLAYIRFAIKTLEVVYGVSGFLFSISIIARSLANSELNMNILLLPGELYGREPGTSI